MFQFAIKADALIGATLDAKSLLGMMDANIRSATESTNKRGFYSSREGSVLKVNPTFNVNETRALMKSVRRDVDALQKALFAFNGSTTVVGYDMSVSAALRESKLELQRAGEMAAAMRNNASIMVIEGDDVFYDDMQELMDEYLSHIMAARALRQAVASTNNMEVVVQVETEDVGVLLQNAGATPLN